MLRRHHRRTLSALVLGMAVLVGGCEKNPVDAAFDAALDFEGYFRAEDGTEIELSGSYAYVRKVGTAVLGTTLDVGDAYMMSMYETDEPGEFAGYVIDRTGLLGRGRVRIDATSLTVTSSEYPSPTGQANWQRTTPPSSPPPTSGGNPPPSNPPAGTVTTVVDTTGLQGEERSKLYWPITVPAGTKEIRVTTTEDNEYGRNLGDIFIQHGSRPTASHHPYTWTAYDESVKPNRENELIVVSNPAAGTWYVMLYGYHAYWGTSLKVTLTR